MAEANSGLKIVAGFIVHYSETRHMACMSV